MAPVRHEQLIRLLACLVVIDLSAGVVLLDARGQAASSSSAAPAAPAAPGAAISGRADPGGVLAAGHFTHRRGSGTGSTGVTSGGASEAAAGGPPSTGGSQSATTGSPASAGSSPGSRVGSRPGGPSTPTGGGSSSSAGRPASPATGPATSPTDGGPTTSTGDGASSPGDAATSSTPDTATAPTTGSPKPTGGAPAGGTGSGTSPSPSGGGSPTGTPPSGPRVTTVTVDDRSGDTVVDGTGKPVAVGRADIVRAQADYTAKAIVLAAQVAQPVDPRQDPNWVSDSTYLSWELDTNGDGVPDYEVQYYLASGAPVANVSRAGDTTNTSLCPAEAGYTADGYTAAVDPACLGGPASVSFRVTMFYDTDPKNPNGDVATDVAPDGGLSRPVARPAA